MHLQIINSRKNERVVILPLQVDEIMLTLKQAFSVAALQQNAKTQSQQCDSCPMQQLHKLCERIEGRKLSLASFIVHSGLKK